MPLDLGLRELLDRYDRPGPRYTSYPPVPRWTRPFGEEDYRQALAEASQEDDPIAVYVHLPFCATRCWYCGCNANATSRREPKDAYLAQLEREIARVVAVLGTGRPVAQMHWGGGTPNYLTDEQIARALRAVTDRLPFTGDAELSIEADPRQASPGQFARLRELGFSRISFGVQDLDPRVQQAIGRVQPERVVRAMCAAVREAGFEQLNLDLIYGLPMQTRESFQRTVDTVLELAPDRVACFGYAHVPWMQKHQRLIVEADLPDAHARLDLIQIAVDGFREAGYDWIGLDHFALADDPLAVARREHRLHRNFMGYTVMPASDLVGFGTSAIGDVAGRYVQGASTLADWRRDIDAGRLSVIRGHRLSGDDLRRREAIMHLMCNRELPWSMLPCDRADMDRRLEPFVEHGMVELGSDRMLVTERGAYLLRLLCAELDAATPGADDGARYSRVV